MARQNNPVHIDYFGTALSDLPMRDKRDPIKVFDWLAANKRFSCFDIDKHLAPSIDFLNQNQLLKTDLSLGYPWSEVEPTERGKGWRSGALKPCETCGGKGYISERISQRSALAKPCTNCGKTGWAKAAKPEGEL